ncbi:hypothetical protein Q3C01_17685 [Bradyrhizobium sp. UFLA05-109]
MRFKRNRPAYPYGSHRVGGREASAGAEVRGAKNEARRQTIGNVWVSVWAIVIGDFAIGMVLWPWLNRS